MSLRISHPKPTALLSGRCEAVWQASFHRPVQTSPTIVRWRSHRLGRCRRCGKADPTVRTIAAPRGLVTQSLPRRVRESATPRTRPHRLEDRARHHATRRSTSPHPSGSLEAAVATNPDAGLWKPPVAASQRSVESAHDAHGGRRENARLPSLETHGATLRPRWAGAARTAWPPARRPLVDAPPATTGGPDARGTGRCRGTRPVCGAPPSASDDRLTQRTAAAGLNSVGSATRSLHQRLRSRRRTPPTTRPLRAAAMVPSGGPVCRGPAHRRPRWSALFRAARASRRSDAIAPAAIAPNPADSPMAVPGRQRAARCSRQ